MYSSKLLATTLLLPLIAGCAGSVDSFRDAFGRETATLSRSTLDAMPCIGDAIRRTFGVEPKSDGSYLQMGSPRAEHVKTRMTVALTPSESGVTPAVQRSIDRQMSHSQTRLCIRVTRIAKPGRQPIGIAGGAKRSQARQVFRTGSAAQAFLNLAEVELKQTISLP